MDYQVNSRAEDKLTDIPKRDFVCNLDDYRRSEFLRKQLIDEADVAIINLNNVLHQVENNFSDCCEPEVFNTRYYIACIHQELRDLFDKLSKETEL